MSSYIIGGSPISLRNDIIRPNSDGSVLIQHGKTSILCTVCIGNWENQADYLPLQVIYQERAYASGKIPGGFLRREGKSDKESIISRMIDRSIRSSVDSSYRFNMQVICTVLSHDNQYCSDMLSIIGSSVAMQLAGIPCVPICGYKMSWNGEKWSFGTSKDRKHALTFAKSANGIVMFDSYGKPVKRSVISEGINSAQQDINSILQMCSNFVSDKKSEVKAAPLVERKNICIDTSALLEKMKKNESISSEKEDFISKWENESVGKEKWNQIIRSIARNYLVWSGKRFDGRGLQDLRKMQFETSILNGANGSGLYSKENTQVLASVTFGENEDSQIIESLDGNYKDRFIFHYMFDPYSCGDIRKVCVSRRDIGHGNLAKRSIRQIAENKKVCRVVADVMSSDGSSSMGSVCASYLAMRDADINIEPVAGISVGMIAEGYKHYLLMDINAQEDAWGDMDFKIAGTKNGITSIQMDIKVPYINMNMFEDAMLLGMKGISQIIDMYPENLKNYQRDDSSRQSQQNKSDNKKSYAKKDERALERDKLNNNSDDQKSEKKNRKSKILENNATQLDKIIPSDNDSSPKKDAKKKGKINLDIPSDGVIKFRLDSEIIPSLIGRKGVVINDVSESSGAQIDIGKQDNSISISGKRESIQIALSRVFQIMKGDEKITFGQVFELTDNKIKIITFDGERKNVPWDGASDIKVGDFIKVTVGRFGHLKEVIDNISLQ
ncbi:hypothetical protein FZC35_02245 [Candidatus Cytomitobacter indipagum]|uniref:K Homology domain-containing protein n=1 Tax=Candidatus Cytomitobacter indipagum TaxID=2601575 RepID=A0A5C0UER6_9PROT|nr:KH domain-containing protein [Candidatus Cytomitobacter indipagum]QEK38181.1 hypothetical protein FZC35_02245 [Candidatus Cytomitobacter indipagum]